MARSVLEIKKTMTDAFMADETIREKYNIEDGDSWGSRFSSVSLENILFFILAACYHVLEMIFDQHKVDVEHKIASAVVASVPWYHKMALAFQYGDSLELDSTTMRYGYRTTDESKQVVKYAAVRDKGTSIQVLVSGDKNGNPEVLSDEVLTVFKQYMNRIKIAGVILDIRSRRSDCVSITAVITIDPLVLDKSGKSLTSGKKPVEEAIKEHLKHIVYGGTFNKTKLVDAIQEVEGVDDVELEAVRCKSAEASEWTLLSGNNYRGVSGSYVPEGLSNSLNYVVQSEL